MTRNVITSMLLVAITLMTVGCNKESITPIGPNVKVSRIYTTSTIITEQYNGSTQTWDTMYYFPIARRLDIEFCWTGDRLDSMHHGEESLLFTYDSQGRLARITSDYGLQYVDFEYNTGDKVSQIHKCSLHEGDTVYKETYQYFWSNEKLQRVENDIWALTPAESGTKHSELFYTWTGDNVSKTVRHMLYLNGKRDTVSYNYEVNNLVNPFYRHTFWQIPYSGLFISFDGTDGLNKNMLTRCYNDRTDRRFEYTTTGGRITGIHEVYSTMSALGLTRSTTVVDYEIEYVK